MMLAHCVFTGRSTPEEITLARVASAAEVLTKVRQGAGTTVKKETGTIKLIQKLGRTEAQGKRLKNNVEKGFTDVEIEWKSRWFENIGSRESE
jgi:hypothetical protein